MAAAGGWGTPQPSSALQQLTQRSTSGIECASAWRAPDIPQTAGDPSGLCKTWLAKPAVPAPLDFSL